MEEGEKGCNWRAERKQRGARKRQKHRWRTIRVQRPSISRGTVYRVGRTGVGKKQEQQESRGEEKRQINRLKWKHLVEQVGSGNWMQMDGELFVVDKL